MTLATKIGWGIQSGKVTNLDHGKFGRPGPPIQAFGEVSLIHLLPLQPSLQLGGALRANLDQCRLQSGADGADLAPDRFSGPQEPPEIGGGGQGVAAGKELLPAIENIVCTFPCTQEGLYNQESPLCESMHLIC